MSQPGMDGRQRSWLGAALDCNGDGCLATMEHEFRSFLLGSQDLKVNLCGLQQDICSDGVK